MTAIAPELLKMLRCPDTRQPLQAADSGLIERFNKHIAAGGLRNHAGLPVAERLDGGLVRTGGSVLHPIRQGIPILLAGEGIPLERG